ncbi:hypothetical protein GCM10010191_33530 [Actinomadura vinacea]|uniref:Uncharacterized protein n=1 Tax=Actinomadura vinacea TaxID=115336 RepID=A0ABN3J1B4_9ACTN
MKAPSSTASTTRTGSTSRLRPLPSRRPNEGVRKVKGLSVQKVVPTGGPPVLSMQLTE